MTAASALTTEADSATWSSLTQSSHTRYTRPSRAELDLEIQTPAGMAYHASRGTWIPAPHLVMLSEKLQLACAGRIKRLAISMPPRHGKSQEVSEYLPPFKLKHWPDHRVILTSYGADFAAEWGRKSRDVIETNPELVGIKLRQDSKARDNWNIEGRRGGMQTAGVGGDITGKGANLLIVDDPIKNAEEANSKTIREAHKSWWKTTARTRLEPGASAIVMCTRWHEDDLLGWLLAEEKNGGDKWVVVNLPAIATEDEDFGIFRRRAGDALWPARYPLADLEQTRISIGTYWWSALYQQKPQPAEGGKFKRHWFRYYKDGGDCYVLVTPEGEKRVLKSKCWRFSTQDLAASKKDHADYFVTAAWAVTPENDIVLLEVVRVRLEGPDQTPLMRQMFEKWSLAYVGIESVGYQLSMVQTAMRNGLPVQKFKAESDKISRAITAQTKVENGTVYFPTANAPWLGEFEAELLAFPTGAHDDQVDALSYAAIEVSLRGTVSFTRL